MASLSCAEVECHQCGKVFEARSSRNRFCSSRCRYLWRDLRRTGRSRVKPKGAVNAERCVSCGGVIVDRRSDTQYCDNPECQAVKLHCQYLRRRESPVSVECSARGCDKPSQARGMCSSHYSLWWRKFNPHKSREGRARYDQRRRAFKAGAFVEKVDRNVVFERDNWRCHLCGKSISRRSSWPDPLSPSIDHIVPLSMGGDHSYANIAAAHYSCNAAKGNRGGGEQLALI